MKILIADDYIYNRIGLGEIIEILGHEYTLVSNGQEVLDVLKKEVYDLILLDIEMPVLSGVDTIHAIRKNKSLPYQKIIIIAISAHHPETFLDMIEGETFDGFLSKPYSIEKIKNLLQEIQILINNKK